MKEKNGKYGLAITMDGSIVADYITTGTLKSLQIINGTGFSVDSSGYMIASSGTIGGFNISADNFSKDVEGTYEFSEYDVITAYDYVRGNIDLPDAILDLYDITGDGNVNVLDIVAMLNIIKGTKENEQTVKGTVEINPLSPTETFCVKSSDSDLVKTVIGLFNIYAYNLICANLNVGEYDLDTSDSFQGVQINKDTKQILIKNNSSSIIIGMDSSNRCTIQPSTGTIVTPSSNIETVNVIASGYVQATYGSVTGYCMHGRTTGHRYTVDWGTSLQFYVDVSNVGSLSDARLKTDVAEISNELLKAINKVELKQFKLVNKDGRTSVGIVAQDLIQAFKEQGLNYEDYDLINMARYNLEDDTLYYMVNYEQLMILKNKCLEKRIDDLEKRILKLEKGEN